MRTKAIVNICLIAVALFAIGGLLYVATDIDDASAEPVTTTQNGIIYALDEQKYEATVTSFTADVSENVVIPDVIYYKDDGFKVKYVAVDLKWEDHPEIKIASIDFGHGICEISDNSFHMCSKLKSVIFGTYLDHIGNSAFAECTELECVNPYNGIGEIGDYAFFGCTSLKYIFLPGTVTYIGAYAFSNISLEFLSVEENKNWGPDSISGMAFSVDFKKSMTEFISCNDPDFSGNDYAIYGEHEMMKADTTDIGAEKNKVFYATSAYTHKLYIYGTGEMRDWDSPGQHFGNIYLNSVVIFDGVTSVGNFAFAYNTYFITDVQLAGTITSLGAFSFLNSHIRSISMPDSITYIGDHAFQSCAALNEVRYSENLTYIGSYAFENSNNLSDIYLPSTLQTLGYHAFVNTDKVDSIRIDPNENWRYDNKNIDKTAFSNYKLNVDWHFFYDHSGCYYKKTDVGNAVYKYVLETVTYFVGADEPASIISELNVKTGKMTLYGEGKMINWSEYNPAPWYEFADKRYDFAEPISQLELYVQDIGEYAFFGCMNVSYIYFPSGIETIGCHAFDKCIGLQRITVEPNVNWNKDHILCEFNDVIFYSAYMETIKFNDENFDGYTYAGDNAEMGRVLIYIAGKNVIATLTVMDGNMVFEASSKSSMVDFADEKSVYWKDYRKSILHVTLDDNIDSVGDYAFYGCGSLTGIDLGSQIGIIGVSAFEKCSVLMLTELPSCVTEIHDYAFSGCESIIQLTVGGSVSYISSNTFDLPNLARLTVRSDPGWGTASVSANAFTGWKFYLDPVNQIVCNDPDFAGNTYVATESGKMSITYTYNVGKDDPEDVVAVLNMVTGLLTVSADNSADMMNFSLSSPAPWSKYSDLIKTVRILENVRTLGDYAFYGLSDLYIEGADPSGIALGSAVFLNVPHLYVGKDRLQSYRTSWGQYYSIIYEIVEEPKAKTNLRYTGSFQYGVDPSDKYILSGDSKALNAGDYTLYATLKDGYCWTDHSTDILIIDWSIGKASLFSVTLRPGVTFTYNGSPNVPTFQQIYIMAPGSIMPTDVDITATDCIDAGTAKMTVAARSDSMNYCGSVICNYVIHRKAVTADDFTVDTGDEVYDGKEKTKSITSSLILDKDYAVSYGNNVDAGTASIEIKGKGNYTGTLTYTFIIKKLTVAVPEPLYYLETGKVIEFKGFPESAYYTETTGKDRSGITAGTYTYHFELNDGTNTAWSDALYNGDYCVYITVENKVYQEGGVVIAEFNFFEKGVRKDAELQVTSTYGASSDARAVLKDVNGIPIFSYDIKIIADGKEIQPDGKVTVKLLIPSDISSAEFDIYHLHNGAYEKVSYTIEDEQYAVFTIDSFSEFVFMKDTELSKDIPLFIILGLSVLVALSLIGVYLIRKH